MPESKRARAARLAARGFLAVALLAAASGQSHAMAPFLAALGAAWSAYQQYDQVLSSAEKAALDACMGWAMTEGAARERARLMAAMHRPMATSPKAMAAIAGADAAMGQTQAAVVPAACQRIPQGGVVETLMAMANFLDNSPTPTAAAHIVRIRAAVAAKRAALGLPPLELAPPPRAMFIFSTTNEPAKANIDAAPRAAYVPR